MYKKELCAIVEFGRKYEHMLKSVEKSVIMTDHKPLTYFLESSMLDGIYARWASELRFLGVGIQWIPGHRNVVADALCRTIFPDDGYEVPSLEEFGEIVEKDGEPLWVWKDGKGGYEELLKKVAGPLKQIELEKLVGMKKNDEIMFSSNLGEIQGRGDPIIHGRYFDSEWYGEIVNYLSKRKFSSHRITKVQQAAKVNGRIKRCIVKEELASVLQMAHDEGGHFSHIITLKKLGDYHWPRISEDVRDYIKGCLTCARFGTAIRTQLSTRVAVNEPMELLGIDFIGPFPRFQGVKKRWILMAIDYFSRYVWTLATERNDSEAVIRFLKEEIFEKFGIPVGMYMDPGTHFGEQTRIFAESSGVIWYNSHVAAKRAVGMIEKTIDILQRVLKKCC